MKHLQSEKKLNRDKDHRKALIKVQLCQLIDRGSLKTTDAKAKLLKQEFMNLVNKAKDSSLSTRRQIRTILDNETLTKKLFDEIIPKLQDKTGGYLKSIRHGKRQGDNTMMTKVELAYKQAEEKIEAKKETKNK